MKRAAAVFGVAALLFFAAQSVLHASEEDQLFDENSTKILTPSENKTTILADIKSTKFSGRLDGFELYHIDRNAYGNNQLSSFTNGDLLLDVRLQKGVKAFTDLSILSLSRPANATSNATFAADIKEMFIDFNVDNAVYFRSGKQFINWGRAYFWNPVDFVNRSHRNFFNLDALRSGLVGERVNVPFGRDANGYMFFDLTDAANLHQVATVTKYEFVSGSSEIGLSLWTKYKEAVRYGFDTSTQFAGWDVNCELAVFHENQWLTNSTIGFSRRFNWERPNRITTYYEFFQNGEPRAEMNYSGRLYHAAFVSVSEFPLHSTTLSANAIQNLEDGSGLFALGLGYTVVDGFQLNTTLVTYFGNLAGEYRASGAAFDLIAQSVLLF